MRRPLRRSRVYLAGAVVMAAAALMMVRGGRGTTAFQAGPSIQVVVAAQPIARGARLQAEHLELSSLPERYAPPGSLRDIDRAAGRVVLADLAPGEVVTETRLARVRAGPVASLVPRGLRAFAVPTSLPAGALQAGDLVDVLATYAGDTPRTELAIPAVEVLAVLGPGGDSGGGLHLDVAASGAATSTTLLLLVSPEQEQRLAFAQAFANLEVTIVAAE